jgi:hypothetical protein
MTASVTTDLCDLVTAARLAEPKLSATQVQAFTVIDRIYKLLELAAPDAPAAVVDDLAVDEAYRSAETAFIWLGIELDHDARRRNGKAAS